MLWCTWKCLLIGFENDGEIWTVFVGFAKKKKKEYTFVNNIFLGVNQKAKFSNRGAILYFLLGALQMQATPL